MQCLTVVSLLLSVLAQPTHLRQSDSNLYSQLQTQVQSADALIKSVRKDIGLITLAMEQEIQLEDAKELQNILQEDQENATNSQNQLEETVNSVEKGNLRSEMKVLYRSAEELFDDFSEIQGNLSDLQSKISEKFPKSSNFMEITEDLAQTPSVDQLLEIAGCLETLIRAHRDVNNLISTYQGQTQSIKTQESVLMLRKNVLRGTVESQAEALQKQRELIADAQAKVANALTALQSSAKVLAQKGEILNSLQAEILAYSQ